MLRDTDQMGSVPLDRRRFLQSLGGGLLVLWTSPELVSAQESGGGHRREGQELSQNISAWLHIAADSTIKVFTGKVEVGQNIRTSLTQAVADELRCDPAAVNLLMGDTEFVPWDAGTFGSRTTPTMAPELRRMASTARELLIDTAANDWQADRAQLQMKGGCILHQLSGRKASVGELAAKVNWVEVIANPDCVTAPARWQVAGTSVPKVNGQEIVTGRH